MYLLQLRNFLVNFYFLTLNTSFLLEEAIITDYRGLKLSRGERQFPSPRTRIGVTPLLTLRNHFGLIRRWKWSNLINLKCARCAQRLSRLNVIVHIFFFFFFLWGGGWGGGGIYIKISNRYYWTTSKFLKKFLWFC